MSTKTWHGQAAESSAQSSELGHMLGSFRTERECGWVCPRVCTCVCEGNRMCPPSVVSIQTSTGTMNLTPGAHAHTHMNLALLCGSQEYLTLIGQS